MTMRIPPLLVCFDHLEDYLRCLSEATRREHSQEIEVLHLQKLPPIVSKRCLAVLFGYSPKFVGSMYSRADKYYREFTIPKGQSRRLIQAPRVSLKVIQKWFSFHLEQAVTHEDCVHGFVPERSSITAAAIHCGAEWVYSVDIKDFFPSIKVRSVKQALMSLGYSDHGADLAAYLCTHKGSLSQGSPASPVLSNLIFKNIDTRLMAFSNQEGIRYTRYADDLVFSGAGTLPEEKRSEIKRIVSSDGWTLADKKENYSVSPARLKVHGLLVQHEKPRLTKGYRKRMRAYRHLLATGKIKPEDLDKIKGHLSYEHAVDSFADLIE